MQGVVARRGQNVCLARPAPGTALRRTGTNVANSVTSRAGVASTTAGGPTPGTNVSGLHCDAFDTTVSTRVGRPEQRYAGPISPLDLPVPVLHSALRIGGAVLSIGGIGGGIAIAVLTATTAGIALGILLALAMLIAAVLLIKSEVNARDAVAVTGENSREFRDFSGEVRFTPAFYERPNTEEEVATILRRAAATNQRVKPIGSGHSWVGNFATTGILVSLDRLNHMQVLDREQGLVSIGGGAKLEDIAEFLSQNGLRFQNLGGIAEQSIAGAISTGTHGSGGTHGILASQVERLRLMTADGEARWLSRTENPDLFNAALVGLGGLGVVTEVVLRTLPETNLRETVTRVPFDDAFNQQNIERRLAANDYFQIIWMPHVWDRGTFIVERNRTAQPAQEEWRDRPESEAFGRRLLENIGLGIGQLIPGLRDDMLRLAAGTQPEIEENVGRSDAILSRPLPPEQRETEFAFPVGDAERVMRRLREAIEREGLQMNFPCAMRFVRGDDFLLSPANRGDSVYISVLLQGSDEAEDRTMRVIQQVMAAEGGRPHWGKENDQINAPQIRHMYGENYDTYMRLLRELDPQGVFRNAYLDRFFPRD